MGNPDFIPAGKIANALASALVVVLIAALSARIVRRRGIAIATGVATALCPTQVLVAMDIQTEPLFLVLLVCAGYLLLAAQDRPSSGLGVLSGAGLALAALTRSSALAMTPLLLAPLFDRRYPRRVRAQLAMSALLGFVLTLAPWTLRNALVFHELILVNDGAGCVFYGRNANAALACARASNREELDRAAIALEQALMNKIASLRPEVRDSPSGMSRALTKAALSERLEDPRGTLRLLAWKAFDWLRPYPDPRYWPRAAVLVIGAYFTVLFSLAAIGFAGAERRGVRAFCLVFLGTAMFVHIALESSWRYRTAYWDPVILVYGVAGAARCFRA